jgi:hypothetical protein
VLALLLLLLSLSLGLVCLSYCSFSFFSLLCLLSSCLSSCAGSLSLSLQWLVLSFLRLFCLRLCLFTRCPCCPLVVRASLGCCRSCRLGSSWHVFFFLSLVPTLSESSLVVAPCGGGSFPFQTCMGFPCRVSCVRYTDPYCPWFVRVPPSLLSLLSRLLLLPCLVTCS